MTPDLSAAEPAQLTGIAPVRAVGSRALIATLKASGFDRGFVKSPIFARPTAMR